MAEGDANESADRAITATAIAGMLLGLERVGRAHCRRAPAWRAGTTPRRCPPTALGASRRGRCSAPSTPLKGAPPRRDPCHFGVFSDEDGRLYEMTPSVPLLAS